MTQGLQVEPLSAILETSGFADTWDRIAANYGDVYYQRRYLRVAAMQEAGAVTLLLFQHTDGIVLYPLVLRPLEQLQLPNSATRGRYDIMTPYEYGGPLLVPSTSGSDLDELRRAFDRAFTDWCRSAGAVAEFVRFHPLLKTQRGWHETYRLKVNCANVVIDLAQTREQILAGMRGSTRRSAMTAIRRGCRIEAVTGAAEDMAAFGRIYRNRMDRLRASIEYYFSDPYFTALQALGDSALLLSAIGPAGNWIAVASFIAGASMGHYHLSAIVAGQAALNPNSLLLLRAAEHMQKTGRRWLHLGGAAASQTGLLWFKAGFSPERRDYCVGSRILDPVAYRRLCELTGVEAKAPGFFPAYRRSLPQTDAATDRTVFAHAR